MDENQTNLIDTVRAALGRSAPLSTPPIPPELDEPIVRLVSSDIGLSDLFARRAKELKSEVEFVSIDELHEQVIAFLKQKQIKRIALAATAFIKKLGIKEALASAGFEVKTWDQMTLDEMYDFDAGLTDADYAIAETGSIAILPRPEHGRGLSLLPWYHICILEPKIFIPDLIDLMEKLAGAHPGKDMVLISGPSKTADIEMNVVQGVHGPNLVRFFILR